MYDNIKYSIKLRNGVLEPIHSNLGLKQGCPLSPMLFNLYIDDVGNNSDELCDPIEFQNEKISHFLYADDLVVLSYTADGLQRSLHQLSRYAKSKHLTVSTKKSKIMIFNPSGKFIKKTFIIDGKILESVQSFCYLGFEVKLSGTVKHAMNILHDKAKKALRPLICVLARFKIPPKIAIRLFHTFISPIVLYNVENWATLTDKKLKKFDMADLFNDTNNSKTDVFHRKLLKCILGVSKSCPNLAVYGETGEIPLSIKGYRLMLTYWHRLTNMPGDSLAKKALIENVNLRTNWILTVEKLLKCFNLIEADFSNINKFKKSSKENAQKYYKTFWEEKINDPNLTRLQVYQTIKNEFTPSNYLDIENFYRRQIITKIRCSDHSLEIESGRHQRIERHERLCKICTDGVIEDEEHFLLRCKIYDSLRNKYHMGHENIQDFLNSCDQEKLADYLLNAFKLRENKRNSNNTNI